MFSYSQKTAFILQPTSFVSFRIWEYCNKSVFEVNQDCPYVFYQTDWHINMPKIAINVGYKHISRVLCLRRLLDHIFSEETSRWGFRYMWEATSSKWKSFITSKITIYMRWDFFLLYMTWDYLYSAKLLNIINYLEDYNLVTSCCWINVRGTHIS